MTLDNSGSVDFATPLGTASVAVNIDFGDGTASQLGLAQDGLSYFGTIYGFGGESTIDLNDVGGGFATDNLSYADGVLTAYQGSSAVFEIRSSGDYTAANFAISADNVISFVFAAPCFTGTQLDTPSGPYAVNDLFEGDIVATTSGPAVMTWVGHRRATDARVIRFRPHALGASASRRDLCVSDDHAMLVGAINSGWATGERHVDRRGTLVVSDLLPRRTGGTRHPLRRGSASRKLPRHREQGTGHNSEIAR